MVNPMFDFRRFLALGACLALLAGLPADAQDGGGKEATTPDPVLKARLDELKLKYDIGPQGDFKLIFDVGEGRSQLVFVQSATEEYGGTKIREIWSPAVKVKGDLDAALANKLLADSQERKIGGWQLMNLGDERLIVYSIKLPDPQNGEELYRMINAAMLSADEMEKELTSKDEY